MPKFSIPYGKDEIHLELEESRLVGVLRPKHMDAVFPAQQQALIRAALEAPIASPRLSALAQGKRRVLVITSDHTRPVPSKITLPLLPEEIRRGNPQAEIVILIATGVHRPTTEQEIRMKFGDALMDKETLEIHRSEVQEDMVFFGMLPSGGELWLNKRATWADLVVSEGFIEPHFFAGFSGGRKSILPGIAAHQTVLYNHNARFIQSGNARQGVLDGNPIHKDMIFAAQKAELAFVLNVLLDEDKRIVAAVAGDAEKAHQRGCSLCLDKTRVKPVMADIVVVSNGGYPLDQNLYQTVKGMTAAEACVRSGGVIIMCAEMADGHGGEAFFKWFAQRENPEAVAKAIETIAPENTQMDQWEAQILARVLCKASCIVVTGQENRGIVEEMHMLWAATPQEAMTMAEERLGRRASVALVPDGVGVVVG